MPQFRAPASEVVGASNQGQRAQSAPLRQARDTTYYVQVRAAVRARYGGPEVIGFDDVPEPVPGRDEIVVRVHATTVNRTDCAYRSGRPWINRAVCGWPKPRIRVLGSEFAGAVVGIGEGVESYAAATVCLGSSTAGPVPMANWSRSAWTGWSRPCRRIGIWPTRRQGWRARTTHMPASGSPIWAPRPGTRPRRDRGHREVVRPGTYLSVDRGRSTHTRPDGQRPWDTTTISTNGPPAYDAEEHSRLTKIFG